MRKYLLLMLFFCSALFTNAQNFEGVAKDIEQGLQQGNLEKINKHFSGNVSVSIANHSSSYSKAQAQMVIKDFFDQHQIKSFKLLHNGNTDNAYFFVGILTTNRGTYRATVYLKRTQSAVSIHDLSLEPQ
jgi:hypothetical protein